jgi:hypothetical protein
VLDVRGLDLRQPRSKPTPVACRRVSGAAALLNLAGLAQLARQRDEELLGEIGKLAQERSEHANADDRDLHIGLGDEISLARYRETA